MARRKSMNRGGKKLKSRLEIYCYDKLKEAKLKFDYEPESFTLVDRFIYPGIYFKSTNKRADMMDYSGKIVRKMEYTPDFVSHEHKFIIETKGYQRTQHGFPLRWKLFLRQMVETGNGDYMLFVPKNSKQVDKVIQIIKDEIKKAK